MENALASGRGDVIDRVDRSPPASPRSSPLLTALALIGLAIAVWLPRGLDLDRGVAPDESIWLARSANFYQALSNGDFSRTYQYAHPGVTTMWAGAAAFRLGFPEYADVGPRSLRPWNNTILPVLREEGIDPLGLLVAAREVMVVFIVLGIVGIGWYATRLLGAGAGLVGSLLLALDPFHVALSQLLHVDALASVLTTLAAVAWLTYLLHGRQRHDLFAAGVALGLAGLTRSSAMVVVPMMAASLVLEGRGSTGSDHRLPTMLNRLRPLLAVGAVALATVVVAWPAMWVDPVSTVRKVVVGTLHMSEEAHDRPIFFDGRVYDRVDPGFRFYPTAFLWRTTPAMLVGLALAASLAAVPLATRRRSGASEPGARAAAYLSMLAILVVLLLSASEKKLDRYVALAIPALALVAGWGLVAGGTAATRWLAARRVRLPRSAALLPAGLLLALTVTEVDAVSPYPLSYYDPLLGGADGARAEMMIGAGEGFDQVAHALDALPDAAEQRIVTSAWEAPITFFTRTASIELVKLTSPTGIGTWLMADYYVWDITSDQRGAIPTSIDKHLAGLAPVMSVRLNGVTYAALYDLRADPIPAALLAASTPVEGGPDLRLLTAAVPTAPVDVGGDLDVVLYLTGDVAGTRRAPLHLSLVDAGGHVRAAKEYGFLRPAGAGDVFSISRTIQLPSYLPAGTYQVVARFGAPEESTSVILGHVQIEHPARQAPL